MDGPGAGRTPTAVSESGARRHGEHEETTMNLTDLVRYWGKTRPAQQAIVFGNTSQTWSEVDAVTDALARGLAARAFVRVTASG